jgi:hypothetical protein
MEVPICFSYYVRTKLTFLPNLNEKITRNENTVFWNETPCSLAEIVDVPQKHRYLYQTTRCHILHDSRPTFYTDHGEQVPKFYLNAFHYGCYFMQNYQYLYEASNLKTCQFNVISVL